MAKSDIRPLLIRMPAALHKAVARLAAKEDRTMAAVVREAIRQYVERATSRNERGRT